jgi:hypothetical protein
MSRMLSPRLVVAVGLCAAFIGAVTIASQKSASAMATAANKFLAGLTPEQRQQAGLSFEGEERTHWNFIPNEMFPRKGLQIKAMSEAQRALAHDLMKAGLSQRGYMTATSIMTLEDILRVIEAPTGDAAAGGRRFARDPLEYWVTVFGTPAPKGAWGWRVEGHHVSLRFVIKDGAAVESSPTFFGSNPAEVRVEGPKKGLRVLGPEEDTARALLATLDDSQKTTAIVGATAPNDMVTGSKVQIEPLSPAGLAASAMKPDQRDLLMKVIDVYVGYMEAETAKERMDRIKAAGLEKISFAWLGETEKGKKHYYRVQGPTFLIEYDNTQNDGNHVHSVWRDFKGDFGRDLLTEHLAAYPH